MLKKVLKPFLENKIAAIVIVIGTIIWSLTMVRSGLNYQYGLGFWGANGHDGIWHLSLSKSLSNITFENPVFAGFGIKNYHLGFDILVGVLHRISTIHVSVLYFQILPPILALTIGVLVYKFVYAWRGSKSESLWATILVYTGSSFGFVVTFLRDGYVTGESMFWSSQAVSTLVNPPFALSLIFILSGLIYLIKSIKLEPKGDIFLSILFFGLLIQIKAYAAILVLGGLAITAVFEYITKRKFIVVKIFSGALVLNLFLFILTKSDGLSAFIWQPFWYLETMMSYSDRLGWERFYSAMTTYKMGHVWLKLILSYSVAFVLFVIGNMGLRLVGFWFYIKSFIKKDRNNFGIKIDNVFVLVTTIILAAVTIPMFFVQSGTPWNTIQFFYYYLFFFAILGGISISFLIEKMKPIYQTVFIALFLVFSSLGVWATLQHYLPKKPQAIISSAEYEALQFLSSKPKGTVFTYPFDEHKAKAAISNPPRPLYFYDSTAYVSAFSDKIGFLEDEVNLNIMGYEWKNRRNEAMWFISNLNPEIGKDFLTINNIKYLYLVKANSPLAGEQLRLGASELWLLKIFDNKEVIIYEYGSNNSGS